MRADIITVSPFNFINVLDVRLSKGVNKHGTAYVKGVILADSEKEYAMMPRVATTVEITASDIYGNDSVLFHGVLDKLNIATLNGLRILELHLVSKSMLLDISPQTVVFQNTDMTYNSLVSAVLEPFDDAQAILNCGDEERLGQMFIQYHETAWAFLIRMSSMHNDVMVVNDILPGIKLFFGFQRRVTSEIEKVDPISYRVKKSIGSFIYKKENRVSNVSESDAEQFIVRERVIRQVGDPVSFLDRQLWVSEVESMMDGSELVHTYTLMNEAGIRVAQVRNFNIIGASFSGQVGRVSGTHVKMILDDAHSNNLDDIRWHLVSTVYSTPRGTGIYLPPEIGDTLRLYCPTEIDNAGYMISAVQTSRTHPTLPNPQQIIESRSGAPGSDIVSESGGIAAVPLHFEEGRDTDAKVIENGNGQRITVAPGNVSFLSSGGSATMQVMLNDASGVVILSDGSDISISGNGNASLISLNGDVSVSATDRVMVAQASAATILEGGIVTNTAPDA